MLAVAFFGAHSCDEGRGELELKFVTYHFSSLRNYDSGKIFLRLLVGMLAVVKGVILERHNLRNDL